MAKKVALIIGVTGQDGAYLADFLLKKGYVVHGIKRRGSSFNTSRIDHLYSDPYLASRDFMLHYGDLSDSTNIIRIIQQVQPDEIYNLGAQSHAKVSFDMPEYTANVNGIGALRVLDAVRLLGFSDKTKIYQASTSELYGMIREKSSSENYFFHPRNPHAVAKLYAYWITVNYREAYQMFACNGIMFNHESPVRGETFVTRKITRAVASIALGLQNRLYLGNLSAERDWGHAKDYVEAMWLMLQQDEAEDLVIATGVTTSVREFVKMSFAVLGIEVEFSGKGEQERGVIIDCDESILENLGLDSESIKFGQTVVKVDARYYRPTEVDLLIGNASEAQQKLNWQPKYDLTMLVSEMVLNDLELLRETKIKTNENIK